MSQRHPHPGTNLNGLRAAVLGANDGIVSIAGIIFGVAGATDSRMAILTAGIAGLVAGALSMAAGEYVSVSSQRDTEKASLEQERRELSQHPEQELEELVALYQKRGLSHGTARQVAEELTHHDPFTAHVDAELRLDPDNLTNPWTAAIASAVAFVAGAAIPMLAVVVAPHDYRIAGTFAAVILALAITGYAGAVAGKANPFKASFRVVLGGALAMAITYAIGRLVGTQL